MLRWRHICCDDESDHQAILLTTISTAGDSSNQQWNACFQLNSSLFDSDADENDNDNGISTPIIGCGCGYCREHYCGDGDDGMFIDFGHEHSVVNITIPGLQLGVGGAGTAGTPALLSAAGRRTKMAAFPPVVLRTLKGVSAFSAINSAMISSKWFNPMPACSLANFFNRFFSMPSAGTLVSTSLCASRPSASPASHP